MIRRRFVSLTLLAVTACGSSELHRAALPPVRVAGNTETPPPRPLPPLAAPGAVLTPVAPAPAPRGNPDAIVDLKSDASAALVGATWRYSDVRLAEVASKAVGPDLKPSGRAIRALDYEPKAAPALFDDSKWESVEASGLEMRRGNGKVSFAWYRLHLTLPETIGEVPVRGSTVAFEVVIDDYAEVWVDGHLAPQLGQPGGSVVSGFNAPNRVVLTNDAAPGQTFTVAVFAMNGPISASPENFIWVRSASLEVHGKRAVEGTPAEYGRLHRDDPAVDRLVPATSRVERLATGFQFTEGPVWASSALLFSDPNANRIYRYDPQGTVSIFRSQSGYSGVDVGKYHQPGSNGLALDPSGRLTICEHGNRRVTRLEPNGVLTVLSDGYEGHRLNSPNDLAYRSDGMLFFTDPPFGLPGVFEDPKKDLPFSGIYRVANGKTDLVDSSLSGPNGIVFSPDERTLYVTNWDVAHKVVTAFDVAPDGTATNRRVFFDMAGAPGEEALDGIEADVEGNLYVSGPGGVWILSPEGRKLGMLEVSELPANLAFGDADGRTLYMAGRTSLYRVRLGARGAHLRE